jgi:hypothetical protein
MGVVEVELAGQLDDDGAVVFVDSGDWRLV